jgi:hypothetical protein
MSQRFHVAEHFGQFTKQCIQYGQLILFLLVLVVLFILYNSGQNQMLELLEASAAAPDTPFELN